MSHQSTNQVLVITKSYQKETVQKHWEEHTKDNYLNNNVDTTFLTVGASFTDDFHKCLDVTSNKDINCIISINDQSSLVHAALVEKCRKRIKGPSFESIFIVQNKYYTRSIIGAKCNVNIPYSIFTSKNKDSLTGLIPQDVSEFIAKPISGSTSKGLRVFKSKSALIQFTKEEYLNENIGDNIHTEMVKLIQLLSHEDIMTTNYCLENGYIIEEYIHHGPGGATFHALECLVLEQDIIPWSVCDNLYWDHRPECFKGNILPSSLAVDIQTKAWNIMKILADELKKYGYINHFLQSELILFPNGDMKLLEMNSHMSGWKIPMHTHLYHNGDPIKASVDLALGKEIQQPSLKSKEIGIHAVLTVFGIGSATEFIDLNTAKRCNEIELLVNEDTQVSDDELSGFVLAYICCYGKSVTQCLSAVKNVGKQILKRPLVSPWFEIPDPQKEP